MFWIMHKIRLITQTLFYHDKVEKMWFIEAENQINDMFLKDLPDNYIAQQNDAKLHLFSWNEVPFYKGLSSTPQSLSDRVQSKLFIV